MPSIRGLQAEPASGSTSCDCDSASSQQCPRQITILYQGEEFRSYLEFHAINYQADHSNIEIQLLEVFSEVPVTRFTAELSPSVQELLSGQDAFQWDGGIFPGQLMGALVEKQRLVDLTDYVLTDDPKSTVDWASILPFQKHQQSAFDHKIMSIPIDGDVLSMYYRRDLFEQYNISAPRTWEEYQAAAEFFHNRNATSVGGEGGEPGNGLEGALSRPIVGSCISRTPKCSNAYWTSLVLSSMTQSTGTSSGYLLDPTTTEPLLGEAMEETLRIMEEQNQVGPTDLELNGDCMRANFEMMNEGSCALTFNWGNQLLLDSGDPSIEIGVAPTPGSTKVFNRNTGQLEDCTPELCPYGKFYEDIGIVNRPAYSAFGGWAGGVSNATSAAKQRAVADFFAYLSKQGRSLPDVLPNTISSFVDPYRYPHVKPSNWLDANGFFDNEQTAIEYTEAIREIDSENAVMEFRIPPGIDLWRILDEEVSGYLATTSLKSEESRQNVTASIHSRMQQSIAAVENMNVTEVYQTSLGYYDATLQINMNYIDPDFRAAGWGLAGLICLMSFILCTWTFFYDRNPVMQAFQPFLLIQSAVGLFFLGATIIPLGFDDSLFSAEILNYTCMATPWIYVFGFSLFYSAVYSKIRMCVKIFNNPDKYDVLVVRGMDAMKTFLRVFLLNAVFLALWTGLDPLKWVREEVSSQSPLTSGTLETYGACRGNSTIAFGFACALFFLNLIFCLVGTLQAFQCRFLVLEYSEMQWLPLSLLPFFEAWVIGGPLLIFVNEDPTITFIVLTLVITVSSITAALAVYAPKDWYLRKYSGMEEAHRSTEISEARTSPAGVMLLNHPTLESRKQVTRLHKLLQTTTAYNTELVNDIRFMKERFHQMTEREKVAAEERLAMEGASQTAQSRERSVSDYEQGGEHGTNEDGLAAMERFASVWSSHDDDDFVDDITEPDEEGDEVAVMATSSRSSFENHSEDEDNFEGAPNGAVAGIAAGGAALLGGIIYARKSSRSLSSDDLGIDEDDVMERGAGASANPSSINRYVDYVSDDEKSEHEVPVKSPEPPPSPMPHGSEKSFAEDSTGPGRVDDGIYGLNKKIEADDLEALEHEAAALAEQFKNNSTFLESVSDLQESSNDNVGGLSHLDISKITTGTDDDEDHNFVVPGSTFGSPFRSVHKSAVSTEDMHENSSSTDGATRPSAGESSGGTFASVERNLDTIEGRSTQNAGEPSGYSRSPPDIQSDAAEIYHDEESDDDGYNMKPPIPLQYHSPRKPAVARASSGVKSSVPISPKVQDSPLSQSSGKNVSYSIADWAAVGATGGLLADLSDSTSTSGYLSATDSFSDLGGSSRRNSDVDFNPLSKEIDQMVAVSDFDAIRAAAEAYDASEKEEEDFNSDNDRLAKIRERKEKKRELEAWRTSLSKSFEKDHV